MTGPTLAALRVVKWPGYGLKLPDGGIRYRLTFELLAPRSTSLGRDAYPPRLMPRSAFGPAVAERAMPLGTCDQAATSRASVDQNDGPRRRAPCRSRLLSAGDQHPKWVRALHAGVVCSVTPQGSPRCRPITAGPDPANVNVALLWNIGKSADHAWVEPTWCTVSCWSPRQRVDRQPGEVTGASIKRSGIHSGVLHHGLRIEHL